MEPTGGRGNSTRERGIAVGVNKLRAESKIPFGAFRIDPAIEQKQVERLEQVKKERNEKTVKEALEYVREVAKGEGNLVPSMPRSGSGLWDRRRDL